MPHREEPVQGLTDVPPQQIGMSSAGTVAPVHLDGVAPVRVRFPRIVTLSHPTFVVAPALVPQRVDVGAPSYQGHEPFARGRECGPRSAAGTFPLQPVPRKHGHRHDGLGAVQGENFGQRRGLDTRVMHLGGVLGLHVKNLSVLGAGVVWAESVECPDDKGVV